MGGSDVCVRACVRGAASYRPICMVSSRAMSAFLAANAETKRRQYSARSLTGTLRHCACAAVARASVASI
jgi:hypothetical protein